MRDDYYFYLRLSLGSPMSHAGNSGLFAETANPHLHLFVFLGEVPGPPI